MDKMIWRFYASFYLHSILFGYKGVPSFLHDPKERQLKFDNKFKKINFVLFQVSHFVKCSIEFCGLFQVLFCVDNDVSVKLVIILSIKTWKENDNGGA